MFNRKRICDGCFNEYQRKEVQPVSTLHRGMLMLCKDCARRDREMATEEFKTSPTIDKEAADTLNILKNQTNDEDGNRSGQV